MQVTPIPVPHPAATTMNTPKANAAASSSDDSSSSSSSSADGLSSTFMQLLIAEIQTQDPTQPMDPTTMITQLVQLNSLSSLESIQSSISAIGTALGVSTTPTPAS